MRLEEIYSQLQATFGPQAVLELVSTAKDPWIRVAPEALRPVAQRLRDHPALLFDTLSNLCGVDYLEIDPKKKDPVTPHLEVVYELMSLTHRHRAKLKVWLPRWKDDVVGQLPEVPSVADLWSIADWHERETFDLVGIRFMGHPHLERILCPDDWEGHPLRKDYDFPLEYEGIRGK